MAFSLGNRRADIFIITREHCRKHRSQCKILLQTEHKTSSGKSWLDMVKVSHSV